MFSVSTLSIWPTADAAEARYRAALLLTEGSGAVELGVGHATLSQLVLAADEPVGVRLGALGERLLVDEVAEHAGGPLQKIARSRGLRRSLSRIFSSLRRVGVKAAALATAARAVDGAAREVARAYLEYERRLGDLFDEAEAWRRSCARLASGAPLRLLDGVERVEIHGVVEWDGARLLLLDALLARGLAVRVFLPSPLFGDDEQPALVRALAPALSAIESRHAHSALDSVSEPLPAPTTRPIFIAAATPFAEAREVARRVRDLIDGGAAPESIVVCAESPSRRALLAEALARYGLPVGERRRATAAAAPPVRLALSLLDLAEERLSRERLIVLASSRYVAPGELPAHRLARVMREAGIIDLDDWQRPLEAWRARHPDSRDGERVAARLTELLRLIRGLPAQAPLSEHCALLRDAITRLQLPARTRGFAGDRAIANRADIDSANGVDSLDGAETAALARDQAALRALELTLDDLPRAAIRLGMKRTPFTRWRFARLLEEALSAEGLRSGGVRGAAVEVNDLSSLAERAPAHLFVCGLNDGELPARPLEDPLLGDDERVRLNRLLSRAALPLDGGSEDRASLAFFTALSRAGRITLSWTRADEEGAPLLRSALIDELGADEKEILGSVRDPLPRAAEARTLDELTARVALEVRGDRGSRLSAPDREASTELYRLLAARAPARMARIEHLAGVERLRERFFSGDVLPHSSVGALRDPALLSAFAARLPGRLEAPLSASALERYAACPFQLFLRLVDPKPAEEVDEELDPLAAGRLHHRALERIFRRLADEKRFPLRGDDAERALVSAAIDEALADWRLTNPIGHPQLFAIWERRLRRQIEALMEQERLSPPAPGCTPSRFEMRFGPLAVPPTPSSSSDGDAPIYLHGVIDRIDVGPDLAVVLDYKSSARQSYTASVKPEALCDTAWQLPIYAAAARAELGSELKIEARFYSLRDVETTDAVSGDDGVALDDLGRQRARDQGKRNLGDELWTLHRRMRGGDFTVQPREGACDRCRQGVGLSRDGRLRRRGAGRVTPPPTPPTALDRIARFERDLIVQAGAGTGKTHALVTLYLHLLGGLTAAKRRTPITRIAVVTFTDKAAGELKGRIRERLAALAASPRRKDEPTLSSAARALDQPLPDDQLWLAALAQLGGAPVGTFHSFAATLLRRHAAAAGIDPDFTLLDENDASSLATEAAERAILDGLEGADAAAVELVAEYGYHGVGRGRRLVEHLVRLRAARAEEGRGVDGLDAGHQPAPLQADLAEAERSLRSALAGFESLLPQLKNKSLLRVQEMLAQAVRAKSGRDAVELLPLLRHAQGIKDERATLERAADRLIEAEAGWRAAPLAASLASLYGTVERNYRAAKQRAGALDFTDLLVLARDLLRDDEAVRAATHARFDAVLVDEFQDTNPVQAELVELIAGPPGDSGRRFVVGDRKQSIYQFRGADVGVFTRGAIELVARGGREELLQQCRRSLPSLLRFNNALFARAMQPLLGGAAHAWSLAYDPARDDLAPFRAELPSLGAQLLTVGEGEDLDAAGARAREAAAIAARISQLHSDGRKWGDVAILLRRFSALGDYLEALRAAQIPHYVVRGRGFWAAQEVRDVASALALLDDPDDALSLVAVLRSPLGGISDETVARLSLHGRLSGTLFARDDRALLPELLAVLPADERTRLDQLRARFAWLRRTADRLGPAACVRALIDGSDLAAVLATTREGEQRVANLERLVERARAFEESGGDLRAFVGWLRRVTGSGAEPNAAQAQVVDEHDDVVRVMTVHQAKGLEFPVVFVPACGGKEPPDHDTIRYDSDEGLGLRVHDERAPAAWLHTAASRRVYETAVARRRAESLRLFYVAATRAEDLVVFSGERVRGGADSWRAHLDLVDAALLRRIDEKELPPPVRKKDGVQFSLFADSGAEKILRQVSLRPPPRPAELTAAVTQLADFQLCPRRYQQFHALGLAEHPAAARAPSTEPSLVDALSDAPPLDPLRRGTLAHRLLERCRFGEPTDLDALLAADGYDPAEPAVAEVRSHVERFLATDFARDLGRRALRRELPFLLAVPFAAPPVAFTCAGRSTFSSSTIPASPSSTTSTRAPATPTTSAFSSTPTRSPRAGSIPTRRRCRRDWSFSRRPTRRRRFIASSRPAAARPPSWSRDWPSSAPICRPPAPPTTGRAAPSTPAAPSVVDTCIVVIRRSHGEPRRHWVTNGARPVTNGARPVGARPVGARRHAGRFVHRRQPLSRAAGPRPKLTGGARPPAHRRRRARQIRSARARQAKCRHRAGRARRRLVAHRRAPHRLRRPRGAKHLCRDQRSGRRRLHGRARPLHRPPRRRLLGQGPGRDGRRQVAPPGAGAARLLSRDRLYFLIESRPPMYGCSTDGTLTVPSAC